jgi:hypothetical protein
MEELIDTIFRIEECSSLILPPALKMMAEDSPETLVSLKRLHSITSQKTAIFKDESLYHISIINNCDNIYSI